MWSDQRLYYTTTTVSGQCNPFINQLPSGYKLRQTRGNASKDYDYDNIYVLPKKLMFLVAMTTKSDSYQCDLNGLGVSENM